MTVEISREKFARWLRLKEGECVGRGGSPYDCPVANCLSDHGAIRVSVGRTSYLVDGVSNSLPRWAGRFISTVDRRQSTLITGRRALKVLESLED